MVLASLHRRVPATAWVAVAALLFMRALVPAGFMPMVQDGHLTMVLCSGTGPEAPRQPAGRALHHMAGMDMSAMDMAGMDMPGVAHDGGGHAEADHSHPPCVFAATALVAPPSADALLIPGPDLAASLDIPPAPALRGGGLLRAQSPRAPPARA
jgi:hypothetical protein